MSGWERHNMGDRDDLLHQLAVGSLVAIVTIILLAIVGIPMVIAGVVLTNT